MGDLLLVPARTGLATSVEAFGSTFRKFRAGAKSALVQQQWDTVVTRI
jgi:hypothetical protein